MKALKIIFLQFGPLIAFYGANHFWGLKAGILASLIWAVAEVAVSLWMKKPLTFFFWFSSGIAIVFGVIDLFLQRSFLFKYEGSLTNTIVGGMFAYSLWKKRPLLNEMVRAQIQTQKGLASPPELIPEVADYLWALTWLWTFYQFAKAVFYFWVAGNYPLEKVLVIRTVVGNVSMFVLLGASILGRKFILALARRIRRGGEIAPSFEGPPKEP